MAAASAGDRSGRAWRVAAASVRGLSHEGKGLPCQDAHAWRELPSGVLIAAAADGAGSAPKAAEGAAAAVAASMRALASMLEGLESLPAHEDGWREVLLGALIAALGAVEAEAASLGAPPGELACTLILVILTRRGAAAAQVGDGAVVLADARGQLLALTVPQSGEYANETTFLVSPGALHGAQFSVSAVPPHCAAVFTDGLQRLALTLPSGAPHAGFFRPLFAELGTLTGVELEEFLLSPRVRTRTDDDLTLLLARCAGL